MNCAHQPNSVICGGKHSQRANPYGNLSQGNRVCGIILTMYLLEHL